MNDAVVPNLESAQAPTWRKLPDARKAITHKFTIVGHEGFLTVGMYDDGTPGEIFLSMAKEGSTVSGLLDAFAASVSMALQYGVPLTALVEKFSHVRFEPLGFTRNAEMPFAESIVDYVFRWLALKFLPATAPTEEQPAGESTKSASVLSATNGPPCHYCSAVTVRTADGWRCDNCRASWSSVLHI
jgi:ribonucleoside-diphosphate reductase alpha chain